MTEQRSPEEFTTEKLPERLPILPLHETALYPKMVLPLVVMQGDSIKLVDEAMQKDRIIGLLVAKADRTGTVIRMPDVDACIEHIRAHQIGVFIVDPFIEGLVGVLSGMKIGMPLDDEGTWFRLTVGGNTAAKSMWDEGNDKTPMHVLFLRLGFGTRF